MIATLDLNKATAEEKEVIAKLEELKRLLLTNDLDLELKLEQLRKLREAQTREQADGARTSAVGPDRAAGQHREKRAEDPRRPEQQRAPQPAPLGRPRATGEVVCRRLPRPGACSAGPVNRWAAPAKAWAVASARPRREIRPRRSKLNQAANSLREAEARLKLSIAGPPARDRKPHQDDRPAEAGPRSDATARAARRRKAAASAVGRPGLPLRWRRASPGCAARRSRSSSRRSSASRCPVLGEIEGDINAVAETLRDGKADDEIVARQQKIESDLQLASGRSQGRRQRLRLAFPLQRLQGGQEQAPVGGPHAPLDGGGP